MEKFQIFQQVKYEHQKLACLLQKMSILEKKWERIFMNFMIDLPKTLGQYDSIWIIVNMLTKSMHR